jgi:predicted XRE-type DNA-binding protein
MEVERGGGNLFRDFGCSDADIRQIKALLGLSIMKILEEDCLSARQAEARPGVSHGEFSHIRQARFNRFTVDRLMTILALLDQWVELSVIVRPRAKSKELEQATQS